ncbi:hypothetical protein N7447_006216 [Penicillium robsamsonii]|uniref:uncharacterized protein n=1 Tax=Penicillium robsamsonii TaxID=1792511 RepID=UPI002548476E|nr:uncharacterized protein N7447_006216 [Penicillium robsamsonii]KAJ5823876.1 hypothetical protein N7447_006216 [Penicillium robsamsonii]
MNSSKWLPKYASPLSPSITSEDCDVLHEHGVFNVPDTRIRAGILNGYFQFVHPELPILSPEGFLMVLDKGYSGSRGISFLLFQAVIFAATAFQSADSLVLEGFHDRKEARQTRFERIKLLYSYGCEEDRITVLQSVLLMTYWDDISDQEQDAWHFVGVAKAILDGVKTNPTDSERKFIRQQPGLWSRISWSCYIRDRLVCLQTRRPFQFEETDFNFHTLQLSDFEVGPLPTGCCLGSDGSHPAIRDPSMRSVLSQISISLLKCCKCITRILDCQYTPSWETNQSTDTPRSILSLRPPHAMHVEVLLRDIELEEWLTTLPDALRWCTSDPRFQISKHGDVLLHFRAMLGGIYSIACSALHRPQLVLVASRLPELTELSKRRLRHSANMITLTYKYFRSQGQTHLFPDSQVEMLSTALAAHLDDLESTETSTRQSAMESFQSCAQGLQQLRDTYPSAASALASVDDGIQKIATSLEMRDTQLIRTVDSDRASFGGTMVTQPEYNHHPEIFPASPTIAQQLDNLNPPQMSKLLCSHFMMTSSERSLLQDLASIGVNNLDLYSDGDSASDEDSYGSTGKDPALYQSQLSFTKISPQTETGISNPQVYPSMELYEHENAGDDWNHLQSLLLASDDGCKLHHMRDDQDEDMAFSMFDTT